MYISVIILCSLLIIGFAKIVKQLVKVHNDLEYAAAFLNDFRRYCDGLWKGNPDGALYEKLIKNSPSMQMKMGHFGYASQWQPPFSNVIYRNYQLIVNLIPQITQTATSSLFRLTSVLQEEVGNYITILDDALLRYIGYLENEQTKARKNAFNPVIWSRDGVRFLIQLPFLLLMWFGIIPERSYHTIAESFVMKSLGFVVAMLGLVSSIVTIVTGYDPFIKLIKSWLRM